MKREELLHRLNEIFNEVLEPEEELTLNETTCADDVEEWDSLSHIRLIHDVEQAFGIRFTTREIMKWQNIGDMMNSIESHTA
ncbi:MAG: acyl carrier protein [Alloprevotella sp.]